MADIPDLRAASIGHHAASLFLHAVNVVLLFSATSRYRVSVAQLYRGRSVCLASL
jgi:hypothetical protein